VVIGSNPDIIRQFGSNALRSTGREITILLPYGIIVGVVIVRLYFYTLN